MFACAYEAVTIALDHESLPTISRICNKHRWLPPVIIVGLALHLYWRELAVEEKLGRLAQR